MPQVKAKELRTVPEPELLQRLRDSRKQLAGLRLQAAQGAIEQPHRIRLVRRELARIQTVLHERAK